LGKPLWRSRLLACHAFARRRALENFEE